MYLAIEAGLEIIPVLNKIDLKGANPALVSEQIQNLYPVSDEEILKVWKDELQIVASGIFFLLKAAKR